jgi:tRNA G18 (ribose-2'-O)-methylase SpoU
MLKIESQQNDTYKKLLSLTTSKGLKKDGLFLLSGEKLIREFLKKPNLKIVYELIGPHQQRLQKDVALQLHLSAELFAELDVLGTRFNILVLEQPKIKTLADLPNYNPQGIEVVIPIGDPGNLGALIRSCEAFAVQHVILTQEAAHPFLPKAVKASAGSVLRVALSRGPALADFPANCIALDMDGINIDDFTWPKSGLLVVGEEGPGIGGKSRFSKHVRIPTQGVESLNVVVAASIALADKARKS